MTQSFGSYGNDNALLFVGTDIDDVKSKLRNAKEALLQLLNQSQTKTNPGKCLFSCSSNVNIIILCRKIKKTL